MLIRKDELVNTGIKYTLEEVKAIDNVERYMSGYKYNKETIFDDIKLVRNCYKINPGHDLLKNFDIQFMKFLNRKSNECEKYSQTVLNRKEEDFYQEALEFERLPFRYSRDPKVDFELLKTILNVSDIKYSDMIQFLSPRSNSSKLGNILYNTLVQFDIDHTDFGKKTKMGWVEEYPKKDREIYDRFIKAKELYKYNEKVEDTKAVGNYAELVFYKYLNKNRKDKEKFLWVSRFIGDGFGYDIMSVDNDTKETKLYEVKGSISLGNSTKIGLTERETAVFRYAKEKGIEYHMVKVYLGGEEIKIYDLHYDKEGKVQLNVLNDRPRYIFVEGKNTKKLSYELI